MAKPIDKLAAEIRNLPDKEKLQLVDAILEELVKPDPEIDRIWAEEARKRWNAYKAAEFPWWHMIRSWLNIADREVSFLSLAQNEVNDAVAWYNEQDSRLGMEFLDELDRTVRRAATFPLSCPEIEPEFAAAL